jgi:CheY-like chemotaxis protein
MARIILADDDPVALDLVARTLEADGHRVTRCCDGLEALSLVLKAPGQYDLLVSDIHMPGLDGITLAERALVAASRMRIVLMSGFSGEFDRAGHLDPNAIRFVTKPLTLEQLRDHVREALTRAD